MNIEGDPFVTYRRRKSRYTGEFEDIQLEDINSDMEQTGIHSDKGKGMGEEEDRMEFCNLVSALQDLARCTQCNQQIICETRNRYQQYTSLTDRSGIYKQQWKDSIH